jgi:transposase
MTSSKVRKKYSDEFKQEALKLADQIGVNKAAEQLSLQNSQFYEWRKKFRQSMNTSERENALAIENAKLKRLLAEQAEDLEILKKAATYFAKNQK